jgi:hypothetical protein
MSGFSTNKIPSGSSHSWNSWNDRNVSGRGESTGGSDHHHQLLHRQVSVPKTTIPTIMAPKATSTYTSSPQTLNHRTRRSTFHERDDSELNDEDDEDDGRCSRPSNARVTAVPQLSKPKKISSSSISFSESLSEGDHRIKNTFLASSSSSTGTTADHHDVTLMDDGIDLDLDLDLDGAVDGTSLKDVSKVHHHHHHHDDEKNKPLSLKTVDRNKNDNSSIYPTRYPRLCRLMVGVMLCIHTILFVSFTTKFLRESHQEWNSNNTPAIQNETVHAINNNNNNNSTTTTTTTTTSTFRHSNEFQFALEAMTLFASVVLMFIVYDWFGTRLLLQLYKISNQSRAIMNELYPARFHQQLLENATNSDHTMSDRGKVIVDERSRSSNCSGHTTHKSIAELYTDVTLMFADIAGFTAWSSTREPNQVQFNMTTFVVEICADN